MQETESRIRLKKTMATQARLLELLDREVKDPLSATGTFFDLVEEDHRGTAFGTEVASKAKRQFNQTLTILDTLLEWGVVHQLERKRAWGETDTNQLLRELFASFKGCSCARRFTMMDRHKGGVVRPLPEEEIRFVLRMILYWLCEVAEDGEIVVDRFECGGGRIETGGGRLRVGLRMRSRTLFARMGQKVERFVGGAAVNGGGVTERPLSEAKPFPAEGFYLAMARDILEEFSGDLWVKMHAESIEAGFEMDL